MILPSLYQIGEKVVAPEVAVTMEDGDEVSYEAEVGVVASVEFSAYTFIDEGVRRQGVAVFYDVEFSSDRQRLIYIPERALTPITPTTTN